MYFLFLIQMKLDFNCFLRYETNIHFNMGIFQPDTYGICITIKFVRYSCRTPDFLLTDRRATVPPIVKTVYILRRKSCAQFGLNFSIFLLCQMKIPDKKNTRHVYLLGKIYTTFTNL